MTGNGALQDDIAIVTGAGRNIGRAIAEEFSRAGATVAVVDIDGDSAAETVDRIRDAGNEATAVTCDVTDEADVHGMVDAVVDRCGSIDVLVNNAAVVDRADFLELEPAEFDRVHDVIVRGTFLCTQAVARVMRGDGGGRIIVLTSTSARRGRPTSVAYATAKSGLRNFVRSAAVALAEHDIRVNALAPTSSGTRTLPPDLEGDPEDVAALTEEHVRRVESEIPLGRMGRPADQARAALFLASEDASFVTGAELTVDGGRSA